MRGGDLLAPAPDLPLQEPGGTSEVGQPDARGVHPVQTCQDLDEVLGQGAGLGVAEGVELLLSAIDGSVHE